MSGAQAERWILVWTKHPSVTTGGKAFFYDAPIDPDSGCRARVIWDRQVRAYRTTVDSLRGGASLLGFYGKARDGMKAAQAWIER